MVFCGALLVKMPFAEDELAHHEIMHKHVSSKEATVYLLWALAGLFGAYLVASFGQWAAELAGLVQPAQSGGKKRRKRDGKWD